MTWHRFNIFLWGITLLLALGSFAAAGQTDVHSELQKQLTAFRAVNGHLFFPEAYQQVQQFLADASSENTPELQKRLKRLKQLIRLSKKLNRDLQEVLTIRQQALDAHAPEFAEDEFQSAEAALHTFARRVASGYRYGKKDIQEIARRYADAFQVAIRTNYLDQALILLQESKDLGAQKYFPGWLQQANQLANEVEHLITQPRIQMELLTTRSQQLHRAAEHLLWLTQRLYSFHNQPGKAEAYFRQLENKLGTLGTLLHLSPDFHLDYLKVLDQFIRRAQTLQDSLRMLQKQTEQQQSIIDSLREENFQLRKEQKTREYLENKLQTLRREVEKAGGKLFVSENTVLIRFSNFPYSPGKFEFPPEAIPKINTFLDAILSFPQEQYHVQVRLPQSGDPAYLQNLALKRADYIQGYLRAQVPLEGQEIRTHGLVEPRLSSPVVEFFFHFSE